MPSPSWPYPLYPQHRTPPVSLISAQVCLNPAAICSTFTEREEAFVALKAVVAVVVVTTAAVDITEVVLTEGNVAVKVVVVVVLVIVTVIGAVVVEFVFEVGSDVPGVVGFATFNSPIVLLSNSNCASIILSLLKT